ncbi:hypothetical protein [Phenylobacterium sp.]|uniref:hypothetical protein n=1 Tax=Phenylobacterium sp. TaxID=1871053 RepID=UPI00301C9138
MKLKNQRYSALWKGLAVAFVLTLFLLNPLALMTINLVVVATARYTIPACRERTFQAGDHAGFQIGMTLIDASSRLNWNRPEQSLLIVGLPRLQRLARQRPGYAEMRNGRQVWPPVSEVYPRSAAELLAISEDEQSWTLNRGKACLVMSRFVQLSFVDGRLVKIVDSPHTPMP